MLLLLVYNYVVNRFISVVRSLLQVINWHLGTFMSGRVFWLKLQKGQTAERPLNSEVTKSFLNANAPSLFALHLLSTKHTHTRTHVFNQFPTV